MTLQTSNEPTKAEGQAAVQLRQGLPQLTGIHNLALPMLVGRSLFRFFVLRPGLRMLQRQEQMQQRCHDWIGLACTMRTP